MSILRPPSLIAGGGEDIRSGILAGMVAVLGWAGFNVGSVALLGTGFRPADLTMLRYGISALICLVLMGRRLRDLGGLGWRRGAVLALVAGPLFGLLVISAMALAPLSHSATVVPAVSMLGGLLAGGLLLGERLAPVRLGGVALMVAGLALLLGGGGGAYPLAWEGDLLFILAGLLWAGYTFLLRRWQVAPLVGVSAVNIVSGLAYLPIYLWQVRGVLPQVSALDWGIAALLQGGVVAVLVVAAYGASVRVLGAARASVFPAAVAPVALVMGVFVLHRVPDMTQLCAVALAMVGLALAVREGGAAA